ncbi:hypothetical protein C8R43DRAFT_1172122, partial [Mycena crocata]
MSNPFLPSDLERLIFELCANLWPTSIRELILVASRVKDWVEPLLYRTIIVSDDVSSQRTFPAFTYLTLLRAVTSKPASFFRDCVKNICLHPGRDEATLEMLLRVCTRVENLSVNWFSTATLYLLLSSPEPNLKYLYTDFRPFFKLPPTHPIFSCLTHIEMSPVFSGNTDAITSLLPLRLLPRLTHLAFWPAELLGDCPRLLDTCKSLAVLIWFKWLQPTQHPFQYPPGTTILDDPRFVPMAFPYGGEDWTVGIQTGMNYWRRAEIFIAKRRTGEIDPLNCEMIAQDDRTIA